jgi:GNAT superfamily N-acetyltransferase
VKKGNNDGVSLAPLEPGDAEPLRRFWSRLSPETRYRRFMIPLASLEAAHLERLLDVDHSDREAMVALVEGEIVGVARYARRAPRPDAAELAVVVADAWQRRGVATRLLSALAHRARRAGIVCFEVMTLADNPAALGLLHRLRPAARLAFSQGVLTGTVSIGGGADVDPRPFTPAAQPGRGRIGVTAAPFIRRGPDVAVDLARRAERLGYPEGAGGSPAAAEGPRLSEDRGAGAGGPQDGPPTWRRPRTPAWNAGAGTRCWPSGCRRVGRGTCTGRPGSSWRGTASS